MPGDSTRGILAGRGSRHPPCPGKAARHQGWSPQHSCGAEGWGADLRGFRTPGWKRSIPACPQGTEPAGMSQLWSSGMDAAQSGILWPLCVFQQGLGGHLLQWRGSNHVPTTAKTQPAPAGRARGGSAGMAGSPQASVGRWRCLAMVGAWVGAAGETKERAKWHGLRKGKKPAGRERGGGDPRRAHAWPLSGAQNLGEQKCC